LYGLDVQTEATIRVVEAGDVPRVTALVSRVLGEFGLTFGAGSDTDAQLAALPASYAARGGRFWVALDGDAVIGTCGLFPVAPDVLELRKMYLAEAARGRGLGRRLLECALAFARERGARRVVLDTTEQMQRAIAFYESNGFVRDDAQIRGARCSRGYARDL
jgi:putative acetyltransferase